MVVFTWHLLHLGRRDGGFAGSWLWDWTLHSWAYCSTGRTLLHRRGSWWRCMYPVIYNCWIIRALRYDGTPSSHARGHCCWLHQNHLSLSLAHPFAKLLLTSASKIAHNIIVLYNFGWFQMHWSCTMCRKLMGHYIGIPISYVSIFKLG